MQIITILTKKAFKKEQNIENWNHDIQIFFSQEWLQIYSYAYLQNALKGDQKQVYLRVKHIQHQRQNLDYHLNVAFISYFKIFIFFLSKIHRLHQSQVIKRGYSSTSKVYLTISCCDLISHFDKILIKIFEKPLLKTLKWGSPPTFKMNIFSKSGIVSFLTILCSVFVNKRNTIFER